ncbi:MAG: ferredoxin family protein [Phycisphaeraceae bacterium]|nr:ferredoxin family protein [Phycisphaeraceae bacterium]
MTYVVCEPCVQCRFTDCVEVCPVEAFRVGVNFLAIDPDTCIDCDLCVPECPVEAIYPDGDVPEKWAEYTELNERLATDWPEINQQKDPMDTAEDFRETEDKRGELDEGPFDG